MRHDAEAKLMSRRSSLSEVAGAPVPEPVKPVTFPV